MLHESDISHIIKRDGSRAVFEPQKIVDAIFKAAQAAGGTDRSLSQRIATQVVSAIESLYSNERPPNVEDVQDLVERVLIKSGYVDTAKRYILYREQHNQTRDTKSLFEDSVQLIEDYVSQRDWRVNENSNMGFSLQGLNNHLSSIVSSHYWLNKIYPVEIRDAHLAGDFHIHDLGLLSVYCCGWDLRDLLMSGFTGAYGKISSAPPSHFRTALGQIVNYFFTLQGESAGAQAFSNFDTYLAPFIAFDNLSQKEVDQAMQEFVYNMNVPTRVGFQTPFTNITMDLTVPRDMRDEAVIVGGKVRDRTYGEFQREMNMLNKSFCKIMMEGDSKGRIFSFPIPTYNITKDFDWGNEELRPIWEMTGKYGIPYFSNFVNSDMDPSDARSMCCRLRLDNRELRKRGGGLFGANPLTGSIGVVTVNMPRLGYLSDDIVDFKKRLEGLIDRAAESLILKRKKLENFTEKGLYPYTKFYLKNIKMRTGHYWSNHFSTIGLIGMNEAAYNLLGTDITADMGKDFAENILDFMREKILHLQESTNQLFNLEATPAEGTAYRLAKKDKELYPSIYTQGEKEPYYTNSSHLPVGYTDDIFEALKHQDNLQTKYTGGTVLHLFLGEKIDDPEMVKNLVRKISSQFHLPYFTVTPTFTICPEHGYIPGEHFSCPYHEDEDEGEDVISPQENFKERSNVHHS